LRDKERVEAEDRQDFSAAEDEVCRGAKHQSNDKGTRAYKDMFFC
jgi:hypothetical protein